ncbi:hypothetical protein IMY05_C4719000400 [Salix suchowensis]|nr:hypothetical protein IMY05_C4719000400 [Salix suchowensis]
MESKVVNAGAKEDIKDILTDGFMVLERVVRLSPVILEYLRETQEAAGGEMMKKMEQEAYGIVLGKVEEAERKAEEARDNGNVRTSEKPRVFVVVSIQFECTEDGASPANQPGVDPGMQYNISTIIFSQAMGQIRYLDEEERLAHARLEHCRRVEEEAQRAEAQVRRVAAHAARIAEHNREVAERDRMIAEEMMAEQARREADRAWVESMTHSCRAGPGILTHSTMRPSSSLLTRTPRRRLVRLSPQPAITGRHLPVRSACGASPWPPSPVPGRVLHTCPGTQAPGYGVPLTYHQHYGSGPSQTTYTE